MISYCPNTGAFLAKNVYENEKKQIISPHAENGFITKSRTIHINGHSRKSNSDHMNGHVVSSSHSDLGPGYTIVEPPNVPRAADKMAPTPDSVHKTTHHVKFSQAAPLIPDFSDPLRAETEDKDSRMPKKLKNQSTQTDLTLSKTAELHVRIKRPSTSSRESVISEKPVLRFRDTPPSVSWSCSSSLSDSGLSVADRVPESPGTDSVSSSVIPARTPTEEIPLSAILIGDSGTGKTCLVARLAEDLFMDNYDVTVGIDFNIARIVLGDGRPVRLQLWDTAGQEKYRSITSSYYRKAMGVILVYDVCRKESLENILRLWKKEVEKYADPDVVLMLVGNKMDLDDHRTITTRVGAKVAEELGASFYEVSAKEDLYVKMAFEAFAQDILENVYVSRNPCLSPGAVRLNPTNHDTAERRSGRLCYC